MTIARTPYDALPGALLEELERCRLDPRHAYRVVADALEEDLPGEDVTSAATLDPAELAWGDLVARRDGVVAGLPVAELVFRYVVGDAVEVRRVAADGQDVRPGAVLLSVHGPVPLLLTAERTALNFLCHLSGVATATHAWVLALEGTGARVRDTRKTTPGFRAMEKYAVRCGGGVNHRASLSDMALVKDNHVLAAGGVVPAYRAVRARYPSLPVQVEVDDLGQLRELLDAGAEEILLDNMTPEQTAEAVRLTAGRARLEASGGLSLEHAREVAATGVDFLAVGALTHSAPILDIGLDLRPSDKPAGGGA